MLENNELTEMKRGSEPGLLLLFGRVFRQGEAEATGITNTQRGKKVGKGEAALHGTRQK